MKNKIYNNIVSLLSVNVLSYVAGFITFPYMTHVLGVAMFGLIGFSQSIVAYVSLIVTYSFSLTGPRDIAMAKEEDRGIIFVSIIISKFILLSISCLILIGILSFAPIDDLEKKVIMAATIIPFGDVIFPIWFFQGIEKMKYITYATLTAKIVTCVMIFILVKSPSDVVLAMLLQSVTNAIAGIYSWGIIITNYRYLLVMPSFKAVVEQLKSGWRIFCSSIAINLYTGSNVFFLGLLTNNTVVGYFVGAQKIMQPVKMIIDTIATAVYPRTSKIYKEEKENVASFLGKFLKKLSVVGFVLSLSVFIFSDFVVDLVLGFGYEYSKLILRILIWIPFIVSFTNVYLIQTLLVFGWQQSYSRIVVSSALLNLIIIAPCIYFFQAVGVASVMLLTELYVATMSWMTVIHKGIKYNF